MAYGVARGVTRNVGKATKMPQAPLSSRFYVALQEPKIDRKIRESVFFGSRLLSTGEGDREKEAGIGEISETGKFGTTDAGTGESEAGDGEESGEEGDDVEEDELTGIESGDEEESGENEGEEDELDGQGDWVELEEFNEEEDDEEEDGVRSRRTDRDNYEELSEDADDWPEAEEVIGDFEDLCVLKLLHSRYVILF